MKSKLFVAFLLCVSALHAQNDSSTVLNHELYLSGGASYPYLPVETRDYWKTGWSIGAGYGVSFEPGEVGYGSLLATVEYTRFAFNQSRFASGNNLTHPNLLISRNPSNAFTLLVNFKGTFFVVGQHSIRPYFLLGVGYTNVFIASVGVSGDTTFSVESQSQSCVAWSAGLGLEYPVTDSFTAFVQGKSILGVADPTRQFFPVSTGIRYRFE